MRISFSLYINNNYDNNNYIFCVLANIQIDGSNPTAMGIHLTANWHVKIRAGKWKLFSPLMLNQRSKPIQDVNPSRAPDHSDPNTALIRRAVEHRAKSKDSKRTVDFHTHTERETEIMISDVVEDEEKWLAAGIAGLQQNAFYMHRALVNIWHSLFPEKIEWKWKNFRISSPNPADFS